MKPVLWFLALCAIVAAWGAYDFCINAGPPVYGTSHQQEWDHL